MPPEIAKLGQNFIYLKHFAIMWELIGGKNNFEFFFPIISKKRKYVILDIGNFFLPKTKLII
jgi:hypothetical protein